MPNGFILPLKILRSPKFVKRIGWIIQRVIKSKKNKMLDMMHHIDLLQDDWLDIQSAFKKNQAP